LPAALLPGTAVGLALVAEVADGFDGTAFLGFFAGGFFFGGGGVFLDIGMAVFFVHGEVIWRAPDAGVAGDAGLIHEHLAGGVVGPFLFEISHGFTSETGPKSCGKRVAKSTRFPDKGRDFTPPGASRTRPARHPLLE